MGVGLSISMSYSLLFSLLTIITLLARSQSLNYNLFLLAILIKNSLPGPYLNSYF